MSEYHGVVYTQEWVVKLILDIAGYTTEKPLLNKVIVEPSCGDGSFLGEIIHRLLYVAEKENKTNIENLYGCIRSYDLDPVAVNKCRQMVKKELTKFGLPAEDIVQIAENWVVCSDYLLEENTAADFVVGNPPYLRSTEILPELRKKYVSRFSTVTNGCDLFIAFFHKGLESILSKDGVLCFICADRWMQNQYGKKLRNMIASKYHIDTLIKMHGVDAFEVDVSAYPAITKMDVKAGDIKYADCDSTFNSGDVEELKMWLQGDNADYQGKRFSATKLSAPTDDSVIPLAAPDKVRNVTKLINQFPSLEDSGVKIGIGLATGKDDIYIVDDPNIAESDRMLPMFNMRDWRRTKSTDHNWLVNPWGRDGKLVNLSEYPMMRRYFENHRRIISSRHVAKKNSDTWYRTIDKINWDILGVPMLLFPDMAMRSDPVYSDGSRYPCHNCYWLISDTWDIKVLGGLLMSDVVESFVDALGVKMRGGTKRFQAQYLRMIHVPYPDSIKHEIAKQLKEAFEKNDRETANKAALIAYGLEK